MSVVEWRHELKITAILLSKGLKENDCLQAYCVSI